MKKLLTLAVIAISFSGFSQISFKTGDSNFDAELNIVNKEAEADLNSFKKSLKDTYNVTTEKIDNLLDIMKPAEALLTVKIAEIAKKPIDSVVDSYKVNKDKGWGQIAKEMGIKPGSPEFHALKGKSKKGNGNGNGNSNGKGKGKGKK
jgi:hypothetical protein